MPRAHPFKFIICQLAILIWLAFPLWAAQTDELLDVDDLYNESLSQVTPPRILRPISSIAENITVITADQITSLNAHTLADVLNTIPGIQLDQLQTPGSWTDFNIQGAYSGLSHVLVLIDGVRQNSLEQGMSESGLIPVQQIERIEIIKGAASTSWGQALGGIVNIITKSSNSEQSVTGILSSSIGDHNTGDRSGEISGTINRLGYYISGGNIYSKGLLTNNAINNSNGYGKFTYQLPGNGKLDFAINYRKSDRGLDENILVHDSDNAERFYSSITLNYPLAEKIWLELAGSLTQFKGETKQNDVDNGLIIPYKDFFSRETSHNGEAKIRLGDSLNNLVTGLVYNNDKVKSWNALTADPAYIDITRDAFGFYSNGAFSLGPLTILPGIRFDHTGLDNDCLSYTLGSTYRLTEKTLFRAYGAKGFGLPLLSFDNGPQRVWTLQAGLESEAVPYVWLKGTIFYNDITNAADADFSSENPSSTFREQIKQGFELEAKSVPLYGLSLAGGYTYLDARDRESGNRLKLVPSSLVKASLNYENKRIGTRGVVTGNYVDWNAPVEKNARYSSVIIDLHLTQRLMPDSDRSPELFFSVRNLLDGAQYQNDSAYASYKNTPRWIEGGVRVRF